MLAIIAGMIVGSIVIWFLEMLGHFAAAMPFGAGAGTPQPAVVSLLVYLPFA